MTSLANHEAGEHRSPTEDVTRWLIEEARDKGARLSATMAVDERVLATGVTLIGIAASVAVAQGKSFLLMVVPVALASLFAFIAYRYSEVFALSGYLAVLEDAIQERAGTPVSGWESFVAETRHKAAPVRIFLAVITLAYLGSAVVAIWESLTTRTAGRWGHSNSTLLIVLTIMSIVVGTAWSVLGFRGAREERGRVEALCRERLLTRWVR